jgi:dihydroorotate dehydrogenase
MIKPWCWLPAQLAHDLAPYGLKLAAALRGSGPLTWQSRTWRGLHFPNPLGIAGGVDKTGHSLQNWWKLGAGFIELGTVTPRAQEPNPGRIVERSLRGQFLWNRMGFPSPGADTIARTLRTLEHPYPAPLFINVGKNRNTPLSGAARDYLTCIEKLDSFADAFVLNISSPNTQGLRELQASTYFADFLAEILTSRQSTKPVLIKLSPDMSEGDLQSLLSVAQKLGVAGFVLTNTTVQRPTPDLFPDQGGFSGAQVRIKSRHLLQQVHGLLGSARSEMLLVSVGGVASADDVRERLALGADLVQVYSALVFEGPFFFKQIAHQMTAAPSGPMTHS